VQKYTHPGILIASLLFAASLLASCGGTTSGSTPTANTAGAQPVAQQATLPVNDPSGASGLETTKNLSADAETYYKTMVFIQGTAQLMAKIDLAAITSSDNQAAFLPLMTMPGVMDDRVIAANALPMPAGFESAWDKATEAETGLTQALQDFLMTYSQDEFNQAVASNEALAAEAVAEAETIMAGQYGASPDDIATANHAALTEMGEAYQAFASMIVSGQAQSGDGSE
jgi:hypothetical protein